MDCFLPNVSGIPTNQLYILSLAMSIRLLHSALSLTLFLSFLLSSFKVKGQEMKQIEVNGLRYSTTLEELKVKLFGIAKARPSRTMIHKNGRMLLNDRCSLLYYNIAQGTLLDAVQVRPVRDDLRSRLRVFVRPNYGYSSFIYDSEPRKTQVHWVDPYEPIKVLKEMMYEWTGISIQHQRLVFAGRHLDDNKTLSDYKVYEDCTIGVVRVRGAGENQVRTNDGWSKVMSVLELDHFGYLLGKLMQEFREDKQPPQEVKPCKFGLTDFAAHTIRI